MRETRPRTPSLRGPALALGALVSGALAAAAGPPAAAREAPRQEAAGQEAEPADDSARELRRVLVLRGDQVARGVTRLRDGRWELKEGGTWIGFDERMVTRVTLERDALREMERREKELGDAPGERVAFAGWLAEAGLFGEALEQIDRVLLSAPHERAALRLLASRRWIAVPSLDVPAGELEAAVAELVTFGAKAPRAGRELALLELAGYADREGLRELLLEQLGDGSLRRRSFAAHALGRLEPNGDPRRLLIHAVLDTSDEVRREASFALGASESPGVILPLVKALNSENARVRTQAAEALGNVGFPAAVEPLVGRLASVAAQRSGGARVPHGYVAFLTQKAYIQDFDVEVAQFQAVADPQVNVLVQGDVLEAGVSGVQHFAFAYESKVIRHSLGQLTGERPGYTSRAWLDWWDENASRWSEAALLGGTAAQPAEGAGM